MNTGERERASVGEMSHMQTEQSEEAENTMVESTSVVDRVDLKVVDPVSMSVIQV
jgi:hypothetical protein